VLASATRNAIRPLLPTFLLDQYRRRRERLNLERVGIAVKPLGSGYGGYAVPKNWLKRHGACCCLGAGEDISFELALAQQHNCKVDIFDPTPRSIAYVEEMLSSVTGEVFFHPYGAWSTDKSIRFFAPEDKSHVSYSALNMQKTEEYFEAECKSPRSMLAIMGVASDDLELLKLNIEGAEYEVLHAFLDEQCLPTVVCITYDELHTEIDDGASDRMRSLHGRMLDSKYRVSYAYGSKVTYQRAR